MPSVSEFLIERLENAGVGHIPGVPGDYILNFIKKLEKSKIKFVNTTDESHAGFVADAYARLKGIGCVCTTYNVGTLKLCNAIAGAYAERSPVIVLSGSPGLKERNEDFLLHHVVKSFDNQQKIFKNITCYSVILEDPTKAGYQIDEAIEAARHHKQPVYIEIPRDVADLPIKYDVYRQGTPKSVKTDNENLKEAIDEVKLWIASSQRPVILAGVQLTRFGLGGKLVRWAEKNNIPMVTTLLSKSTINEHHYLFAGLYSGNHTSQPEVKELVENSDCLLVLGEMLTDIALGFESPKFNKRQTIECSIEELKVRNHSYQNVCFTDFCEALFKQEIAQKSSQKLPAKKIQVFTVERDKKLTTQRFFDRVNCMLTDNMAVVADIGECLFGAADLTVQHHNFISPAFYSSMGSAIPGAVGVGLAKPSVRPIVLVGDGAFQMSCTELSTLISNNINAIVFVLNNKGYTTERFLLEGKFNDIKNWNYHRITDMIGGWGAFASTESELESAIETALKNNTLSVINVSVDQNDTSNALRRMATDLAKRIN